MGSDPTPFMANLNLYYNERKKNRKSKKKEYAKDSYILERF